MSQKTLRIMDVQEMNNLRLTDAQVSLDRLKQRVVNLDISKITIAPEDDITEQELDMCLCRALGVDPDVLRPPLCRFGPGGDFVTDYDPQQNSLQS